MPDTTQGSAGLCDLCGADALEQVYRPEGSARGLTVHLCTHCGLVQSLPRIDHAPRRAASVSSGADWGNVRYGKGFRAAVAVDRLLPRLSGLDRPRVLDVGASRGAFIEAFRTVMPQAEITAVEPDTRVIGAYGADPSVTTIRERIEEVRLPEAQFDIVHSCHTLEHLRSPADTMRDHWRVLKPGGLLFAEVPSLAFLDAPDIVEEWFIDKHLYHFSYETMLALLHGTGFRPLRLADPRDTENLTFLAVKAQKPAKVEPNEAAVGAARRIIGRYRQKLAKNRAALRDVVTVIREIAGPRPVIWGAGRLFDALVLHGGLDPARCAGVIDRHLSAYVSERHGVPLRAPDALPELAASGVIIMSRSFASEIEREIDSIMPGLPRARFADLFEHATAGPSPLRAILGV